MNQDHLFRASLLLILIVGLGLAAWHISWLHKQNRYEVEVSERGAVFIIDHQRHVIHAGAGLFSDDKPVVWHTSPLP